jgi:hypothetical protein
MFLEMVRSPIASILAGYEDPNDLDTLRADPASLVTRNLPSDRLLSAPM